MKPNITTINSYDLLQKSFEKDAMFQKLMMALKKHRIYFINPSIYDPKEKFICPRINEIAWWLTKISTIDGENSLYSSTNLKSFALFLYIKYIILNGDLKNISIFSGIQSYS